AGQNAAAVVAEEHPAQDRRKIDRRGIEREVTLGFASALDPVNVLGRALLEKNGNAIARVANAASELLELGFEQFVIGTLHHVGDARLERGQSACDRVRDK